MTSGPYGFMAVSSPPFLTSIAAFVLPLGGIQAVRNGFRRTRGLRHATLCVAVVSRFFAVPLDSGFIFLFLSIFLPFTLSVFLAFFPLSLSVRLYLRLPPCRPFHFAIAKEIVNTARCRKYIIIRWRTGENKSRHV